MVNLIKIQRIGTLEFRVLGFQNYSPAFNNLTKLTLNMRRNVRSPPKVMTFATSQVMHSVILAEDKMVHQEH